MSARQKIVCVLGTRPEAIKLAPIIRCLRDRPEEFDLHVCSTGQHREMLDQALGLFGIKADSDLRVMAPNQGPGAVAGLILQRLDPLLAELRPDWLLIQGDTTSVAAAGLCAFYRHIRVGHVEAGLRTGDRWQPFPEEINRRVATVVTDLHFAATAGARHNLLCEGIAPDRILVTGNPVIDALQWVCRTPPPATAAALVPPDGRKLILVTVHRRESFGEPLREILGALRRLADEYRDSLRMILPVHLNPQVRQPVMRELGGVANVTLTEPLDYRSLTYVLEHAELVLTDSGGLQEEAPSLGKPVLVLREVTERPEAVEAGTVRLVGSDAERIVAETRRLLEDPAAYAEMARAINPYGDGRATPRIVEGLRQHGSRGEARNRTEEMNPVSQRPTALSMEHQP